MADLELKNINKIYPEGFQAVYDCNIDIKNGEFIVLVGPSGCGKSTLLRMIAGLEEITSGDMLLDGKRINDTAPSDRDIAMVFQNYALYGNMTVYENMGLSLTVRHENTDKIHKKVMKAADIADLKSYLNRKPNNLSGGQRQRVALGRSIVRDATIFLMDEPLSNLDAKLRTSTRKEIVALHNKLNKTFIYVTHDQIEAMTMADRVVILNKGKVQQIATPSELYLSPENIFVGGFIGSPPMNFMKGHIDGNRFVNESFNVKIPEDKMKILTDYIGKEIILGIRPEHFSNEPVSLKKYSDSVVDCVVDVVEFLGADMLIHFKLREKKLVSKIRARQSYSYGDNIRLAVKMDEVHFFDAETESRIR